MPASGHRLELNREVAAIDGREDEVITVRIGRGEQTLAVKDYALQWVVPNFFFHVATAYGLLRMRGVPLGKKDYIGPLGA